MKQLYLSVNEKNNFQIIGEAIRNSIIVAQEIKEKEEKEVQMICSFILKELRKNYSFILNTEEEYYKMNNSSKYFN